VESTQGPNLNQCLRVNYIQRAGIPSPGILSFLLACLLLLVSCGKNSTPPVAAAKLLPSVMPNRYAKSFRIDSIPGFRVLSITNPWSNNAQTFRWVLVDSAQICPHCTIPDSLMKLSRIQIPLKRIVALSSTQVAALGELGALDRIVGVSSLNYLNAQRLRAPLQRQHVDEVGFGPAIQLERVLALKPDLVMTFGIGDAKLDDFPRLLAVGVPTMVLSDWMETHPLGRLEWIKLLGILLQKRALADSIFADRVQRYDSLCTLTRNVTLRPLVLTGTPQGESWYLTGGGNYFAQLMRDAGGQYLWAADTSHNGLTSTFEQVLERASTAQIWLNPGIWSTRGEGEKSEPRVRFFKAWSSGQVFQHNKGYKAGGGSDFWDLGMMRPDLVLADLVSIFHPELLPNYQTTFYHRLN